MPKFTLKVARLPKNLALADLPPTERQHNRLLASLRVVGEHINRRLKIFRILAERYRNRRQRFGLRFNLIAGLLNHELSLAP